MRAYYGDFNFKKLVQIYIHELQNWFQILSKSQIEKLLAIFRFTS